MNIISINYFIFVIITHNWIIDVSSIPVSFTGEPECRNDYTCSRWKRQLEDEEEDEETTVKGPGHEGILKGLSGIFSNIVAGNANGIVESTFNFVPPVYQKNVGNAYVSIVGRTTSTPRTTTIQTKRPVPQNFGEEEIDEANIDEEHGSREVAGSNFGSFSSKNSNQRPKPGSIYSIGNRGVIGNRKPSISSVGIGSSGTGGNSLGNRRYASQRNPPSEASNQSEVKENQEEYGQEGEDEEDEDTFE